VDFFKAFVKMAAYLIILVFGEVRWNYCRAERLYRNRYPFRRHPNADKKNFITREESVRETASK